MSGRSSFLLTGLPPGWVELAGFVDEAAAERHVDDVIAADAALFDPRSADQLRRAARELRSTIGSDPWLHYGLLTTELPEDLSAPVDLEQHWRNTVWTIGIGLVRTPALGDVDPVAVAERCLGQAHEVDEVAPFELDDGRHGVVLGMRVPATAWDAEAPSALALPQLDPAALGVWACLLPVPGLPRHLSLTVAVAPNVAERNAAGWLAAQLATSLHAVEEVPAGLSGLVLADLSGDVRAGASVLTGSRDGAP